MISPNVLRVSKEFECGPSYLTEPSTERDLLISRLTLSNLLRFIPQGRGFREWVHGSIPSSVCRVLANNYFSNHFKIYRAHNTDEYFSFSAWTQTIIDVASPVVSVVLSALQLGGAVVPTLTLNRHFCPLALYESSLEKAEL